MDELECNFAVDLVVFVEDGLGVCDGVVFMGVLTPWDL